MNYKTETLVSGLAFGEGPRWKDGRLYYSDMHRCVVESVDESGSVELVCRVEQSPSGLGWLPDDGAADAGRMLVVSMRDRRLLRLDPDGLVEVADLSGLATWHCNDMVVDEQGRAYVGNFGSDIYGDDPTPSDALLLMVERDGAVSVAADQMKFPNGTVITPDGSTLIICETFAGCLTAFDIAADGSLSGRRSWAELEGVAPDGCCLDAEGAIWVATVFGNQLLRVHEGGRISDRVELASESFACMLGGEDGRSLFICAASTSEPEESLEQLGGSIELVRVEVPGAGRP